VFLKLGKQGSTLAGVMDAFSIAISIALQYGVPLETFVEKFTNMRFEPAGMTDDPDVRMAQSIMDYVFRRLALDYLDFDTRSFMGIHTAAERAVSSRPARMPRAVDSESEERSRTRSSRYAQGVGASSKKRSSAQPTKAKDLDADAGQVRRRRRLGPRGLGRDPLLQDLLARFQGKTADAPMCMTCGTKMRPAGSCYVCEGCGSTSGCS
jgi:ribonucleoside-diphosphate reductase alpha chain